MKKSNAAVLHVRSTIGFYGAEQVIANVLPALQSLRPVHAATLEGNTTDSGRLSARLTTSRIPLLRCHPRGRFDWHTIKQLRQYIRQHQIGIVHSHDYKSLLHALFARIGTSARLVHHQHGALGNTRAERIYAQIERWAMRFVDRIVVVSAQQQHELQRRFTRPDTLLVLNGTPSRPLPARAVREGPLRLLMVARLTPEKNHTLALDVVQHLLRQQIPVTLKVIGDGPLFAALQQNIDSKGLNGHVELMGFQNNPLPFYAEADLTLITSTTEGLPMTLLESLSCAVPVISTPVGQIPTVINQGHCGRVVVGNIDAFVDAISACHHNRDSLLSWGQKGHQLIAEHYSVQQQAEHLHRIYSAVSD